MGREYLILKAHKTPKGLFDITHAVILYEEGGKEVVVADHFCHQTPSGYISKKSVIVDLPILRIEDDGALVISEETVTNLLQYQGGKVRSMWFNNSSSWGRCLALCEFISDPHDRG